MFILSSTQRRINVHATHITAEGVQYANLLNPEVRSLLGVVEIPDPAPPEDYSDETYYRTEQDEAPYVVYTRKSDEQLEALRVSKVEAKLKLMRDVREGILNRLAGIAFAAQLSGDTATTAAYLVVRQGLLDITTGLQNLAPELVEPTVMQRYTLIAAQCTPEMVGAFAQVDA